MNLFDEKIRNDFDPANHMDNTYDYYDRSGLTDISDKRKIFNEWFKRYPESEKLELKARMKKTFSSAFYELFLHELFTNLGFTLEPHPKLPNSTKRPDFLVKGKGLEFYLEAKEVADKSKEATGLENRINTLYDALNTTNSPNFFLSLDDLILKSNNQPKGKEVVKFIESELVKFDPDVINSNMEKFGYAYKAKIIFENSDLRLELSLIPKSLEIRGKDNIRPVGCFGIETSWGSPEGAIKKSVNKKATRYGKLDKPFLICFNSISDRGTHKFDVMNSLFGKLQFSYSTDPNNREEKYTRSLDGVFLNEKGPQYSRVSAIFITSINQSNFHVSDHWLVKHPFSSFDFNIKEIGLSYFEVVENTIVEQKGARMNEIIKK